MIKKPLGFCTRILVGILLCWGFRTRIFWIRFLHSPLKGLKLLLVQLRARSLAAGCSNCRVYITHGPGSARETQVLLPSPILTWKFMEGRIWRIVVLEGASLHFHVWRSAEARMLEHHGPPIPCPKMEGKSKTSSGTSHSKHRGSSYPRSHVWGTTRSSRIFTRIQSIKGSFRHLYLTDNIWLFMSGSSIPFILMASCNFTNHVHVTAQKPYTSLVPHSTCIDGLAASIWWLRGTSCSLDICRAPKDHLDMRILQYIRSSIHPVFGLGASM